ncbi:hypothetical protein FN846DRAFT_971488 [Sphaerosporella brunnea]|uniref:Uncharacterized protein n=1 Tax=Sphaerosporella brunnea TaxID=1250544 RepID=A0A5J5EH61_9PEZI|nr:hypothetical protein FN846DRAFT_971488 [Sphaerosporella brunnea]
MATPPITPDVVARRTRARTTTTTKGNVAKAASPSKVGKSVKGKAAVTKPKASATSEAGIPTPDETPEATELDDDPKPSRTRGKKKAVAAAKGAVSKAAAPTKVTKKAFEPKPKAKAVEKIDKKAEESVETEAEESVETEAETSADEEEEEEETPPPIIKNIKTKTRRPRLTVQIYRYVYVPEPNAPNPKVLDGDFVLLPPDVDVPGDAIELEMRIPGGVYVREWMWPKAVRLFDASADVDEDEEGEEDDGDEDDE